MNETSHTSISEVWNFNLGEFFFIQIQFKVLTKVGIRLGIITKIIGEPIIINLNMKIELTWKSRSYKGIELYESKILLFVDFQVGECSRVAHSSHCHHSSEDKPDCCYHMRIHMARCTTTFGTANIKYNKYISFYVVIILHPRLAYLCASSICHGHGRS